MTIKHFVSLLAVVFASALLTACNTVEGFGKDMQQGGKNIQQTAQDSK